MRNNLPTMVEPGSNDPERLLNLFLNANERPVNLPACMHHLCPPLQMPKMSSQEPRARCHHLEYNKQSSNETILLLGDFNVGVDANFTTLGPHAFGQFGVDEMN